jgi:hypothetical protein
VPATHPHLSKHPHSGKRSPFEAISIRPENLGAPKLCRIQKKRYNNEIFGISLASDWIFFDVRENPG